MKITNGSTVLIVSRGAFNEHYKSNGWIEVDNAVPDGNTDEKADAKRDLSEIPLSEMKGDELKAYAKLKDVGISGLTKKDDILAAIKAAEEARNNGSQSQGE